ncbi:MULTISPECIES: phosphoribosyl-AMP cyclohydrolase [unclassified Ectothiorhodospira]|uniref:phosphoribosyl-AMP cyclohydrolase n=1 Tax=unclassified Ectothiorhodospira TaxID=2684909 RepID=UPI001EE8B65C|nr:MULTISPECIES: phosphoribosyl-AMP cyclohydrolase [unclassified Ectothiorhodospira]MCG5517039.1 phosphoribosyl-AMP cyclohydrolase [Ectothiorhodospira sp. 9100]MCG5519926.1 phosphoribosyl-AMP cyclohydrolase [Ectothiorhodospira sp. 9905]
MTQNPLDIIRWNDQGLIPVIAQEKGTGQILMMAWMNRQALAQTLEKREAIYWSRSRGRLWHKGESSGHVQVVHDLRLDCDYDALLLTVEQKGGIACHTGRHHCFFNQYRDGQWVDVDPVLKDPDAIYGGGKSHE